MPDFESLRETPLSSERVFTGKIINVSHMQVSLPDGRTALREAVEHPGAAAIVPVDDNGIVTLVTQHRVVVDEMMLEIPAGKLDYKGEDPLHCAVRELEEETGLHASSMELLTSVITTPGFCTERIALYLATGLSRTGAHLDRDEFLSVVTMPLCQAVSLVMSGEIHDCKTALGLLMAARRLRI